MKNESQVPSRCAVPAGYGAVGVHPAQEEAPVRLCALFRDEAEKPGGHLVELRNLLVGRVLLGCLMDAGGGVHRWVEIWLQDVGELAGSPSLVRGALSNKTLDERWRREFETALALGADEVVRTGWESEHPPPVFIRAGDRTPTFAVERESGQPLRLCVDDVALGAADLPPYASSLHRYLYVPDLGDKSPFVAVTIDAPTSDRTAPLADVVDDAEQLIPLNAGGGLIQVRAFSPIGVDQLADVLGGATWGGVFHGSNHLPVAAELRNLSQASTLERVAQGHLLLARHGQSGRLLEVLHLKLRLLADAVGATQAFVETTAQPMLNVTANSFRVRFSSAGTGLPYLWTARTVLAGAGDCVPLPIEGSDLTYYLPGRGGDASVYRPASGRVPVRGEGLVRIRQVLPEANGAVVTEGTLDAHERMDMEDHDLLWMRLGSASGPINLYGSVDRERAMAKGEVRFRSVAQRFNEETVAALGALEGVPIDRVPFEVVPLLSSPCDLYSLAVLAIRLLLVNPELSLPVAVDEMHSLAREVAEKRAQAKGHSKDAAKEKGAKAGKKATLSEVVDEILEESPRWLESLGPQHLVHDAIEAASALDFVPRDVWVRVLALVVRMFPGVGPDSICQDPGDAPAGGLHKIFTETLEELERILVRSRSLIVVDWAANREIHAVVRRFATGLGGASGGDG